MRLCCLALLFFASSASARGVGVSIARPRAAALYAEAQARFVAHADLAQLKPTLERLATPEGAKTLTPADLVRLKAARKEGAVMSSVFVSLDRRHEAPRRMHDYVHRFGKLNDALEAGVPDVAAREARALLASLEKGGAKKIVAASEKFEPSSRRSFDEHMEGLVHDIEHRLRQPSLPIKELHAARKDLKVLMNVAELVQTEAEPRSIASYRALVALNEELGAIHDDVVHRALHGETSYDDTVVDVPAPLRDKALGLIGRTKASPAP